MALKTVTIRGLELMAAGTWQGRNCPDGGCKFTTEDLDYMVAAHSELKSKVAAPVKLGHDQNQKLLQEDGYPAAGWVTNLRRVGDKLIGDLEQVPSRIAELMKAGAYRKRSSEIQPDVTFAGKKYKWVYTGLALLGADLPAVDGLKDIEALYHSLQLSFDDQTELVLFASEKDGETQVEDEDSMEQVIKELDTLVERAENYIRGRKGAPRLRHLVQAAKDELRRVGAKKFNKEVDEVDRKEIAKLLGLSEDADDETITTAIQKLKSSENQDPPKDDPSKKEDSPEQKENEATELSKAQERILALETERAKDKAEAAVHSAITLGKLLPAQKEFATEFALRDLSGFNKFVESQPKVVEFGERGNQGNSSTNTADFEPTELEITQAKQLGVYDDKWKINLMKEKAAAKGVELPAEFGKK